MKRLVIFAPGVHTGGGMVLLKALIAGPLPQTTELFLDSRCREHAQVRDGINVHWCKPSFVNRLKSEIRLRFFTSAEDVVFCFHGLSPMLPNKGNVIVFVQNRLNLEGEPMMFWEKSWRQVLKRLFFRVFSSNANEFIVQTPSMRNLIQRLFGDEKPVRLLPFWDKGSGNLEERKISQEKTYDFIYVADGGPHKNHENLLAAWVLLAQEEIRPSLLLTLCSQDQKLVDKIENEKANFDLHIINVGKRNREKIFELYRSTHTLIFPSKFESFGLPLIEAAELGLPIIASELDYVRDVCKPAATFDPGSPMSIMRAVKRHLCIDERLVPLMNANEFLEKLLDR